MPGTRTQIYLTVEQRRRLDTLGRVEGRTMAALIRDALDRYLDAIPDPEVALEDTFGSLPQLEVPPRSEWDRSRG